ISGWAGSCAGSVSHLRRWLPISAGSTSRSSIAPWSAPTSSNSGKPWLPEFIKDHRAVREQWVGSDQQRVDPFSHGGVESWPEIAMGCGGQNFKRLSHARSRRLDVGDHGLTLRIVRIHQDRKPPISMQELMQKPELLCHKPHVQGGGPSDVTAGPVEANDEASLDRIDSDHEHKRSGRARSLGSEGGGYAARRRDDGHRPPYEISSQLR